MACSECDDPDCDGRIDELRHFDDWADLSTHSSEEKILEWVNKFAKVVEVRKIAAKRTQQRTKLLMRVAKQMLAPDELEEIARQVEEKL